MKIKQLKAASTLVQALVQGFILRAQEEARVAYFRIRIRIDYNEKETQSQTWEKSSVFFDKLLHGFNSFQLYCAFLALNVYSISNTRKVDMLGKGALLAGHPYIDVCLMVKGELKREEIIDVLNNLDSSLVILNVQVKSSVFYLPSFLYF